MTSSRQWLIPLGLVMIVVVVVTVAVGHVGFAVTGAGLLNLVAAVVFAVSSVLFLTRTGLAHPSYVTLAALMAASVVAMRVADPRADVIGLFLLAAFMPLRVPRPVLAVVALLGVLCFNVVQLTSGSTALGLILATDFGAAFFFLVGTLLQREKEQRTHIAALLEQLEASRQAEQEASVAAERTRMAREMHDVLAHTLSGLTLHLEAARLIASNGPTDPRLSESIERAHQLSRTGLAEARRAVRALRGDDLPGPELLPALVEEHRLASFGPIAYRETGHPVTLPPDAALAVYRTAQEAMSNVRKHAPRASVDVSLRWGEASVVLEIADTGDADAAAGSADEIPEAVRRDASRDAPRESGYGLSGMAERAQLAGGDLETGREAGGFRVRLTLPIRSSF